MANGEISLTATIDTRKYTQGADTIESANERIQGSTGKAANAMNEANGKAGKSQDEVTGKTEKSSGRIAAAWGAIAGVAQNVVSKAFDMIGDSVAGAVSRVDTLNNFPKVMTNLGYSADESSKSIKKMADRLQGLPTTLNGLASVTQRLAPVSGSLTEATDTALAFNDALLAGGNSADIQSNAMDQLVQMLSAGKVDMDAWTSVNEAMPGQMQQVAKSILGTKASTQDLYKAMQTGKVSTEQFTQAFIQLDKQGSAGMASFEQQARDATGGIQTGWANMKNAIVKGLADIIDSIGASNISGLIGDIGKAFKSVLDIVADVIKAFTNFAATASGFKAIESAIKPLGDSIASLGKGIKNSLDSAPFNVVKEATNQLAGAFAGLIDGFRSIVDGLNKSGAAGEAFNAVIGGAASVIAPVIDNIKMVVDWLGRFSKALGDNQGFQNFVRAVGGLIGDIQNFSGVIEDAANRLLGFGVNSDTAKGAANGLGGVMQILANIMDGLGDVIQNVSSWMADNGDIVTAALATIAAGIAMLELSKLIGTIGGVISAVGKVVNAVKDIPKLIDGLKNSMKALNLVMSANPWVLLAAAIAAVAAGLVYFFTQTKTGKKIWANFTNWLTDTWNGIGDFFSKLWDNITGFFTDAANNIRSTWEDVTGWFKNIWNGITSTASKAADNVKNTWNGVKDWFKSIWDSVSSAATDAWNKVVDTVNKVVDTVSQAVEKVKEIFKNTVTVIGAIPVAIGDKLVEGIDTVFGSIVDKLKEQFNNTDGVVHDALGGIINFVSGIWQTLHDIVQTGTDFIRTIVVSFLDLLDGDWQGAWNNIKQFFEDTWNAIVAFLNPILSNISNTIKSTFTNVKQFFTDTWNSIKQFFTDTWNKMLSFLRPILQSVSGAINGTLNAIKSTWNSAWSAVSGFLSSTWNAIQGKVNGAMQAVKGAISSGMAAVSGTWNSMWSSVKGYVSSIWNGITGAVSSGMARVRGVMNGLKGQVTGAVSGAGSWLTDTGHQIIQGLIGGIKGSFNWLHNTITSMGGNVVSWAKHVLHIGSPSRVFRDEVGQWIPAGIGEGIDKGMPSLQKDLTSRLNSLVDTSIPIGSQVNSLVAMRKISAPVSPYRPVEPVATRTNSVSKSVNAPITVNTNDPRAAAEETFRLINFHYV